MRRVCLVAGWMATVPAALGLLAFFGSLVWFLDLAANFRPQLAAITLLLGLVALAGQRGVAVLVLAAGVVNAVVVVPHLLFGGPGITGADRIEVMVFNVGVSNPNREEVVGFIASEDPDVVFLFESSFEWEAAIRSADLPLRLVTIVPRGRVAGVTVLARPSLLPGVVEVRLGGEAAALAVNLDGERIEILGLHPPSPTDATRSGRRDRMLAGAGDWVAGRDREVVVVGDLNATTWSHAFVTLRERGGLIDTLAGSGLQPTWPDGWGPLSIPIDHVLHTAGLGSEDRHTGPAFGSAHRPVLVAIGHSG